MHQLWAELRYYLLYKENGSFPFYETPGAIENKWMFMERGGFELGVGGKGSRYVVSLLDTQS